MTKKHPMRFLLCAACVLGLTGVLRGDDAECATLSAGAATDLSTGSVQNLGRVAIGFATDGTITMHAGGVACVSLHATSCLVGDVNGDGLIDGADVNPYVRVLITGIGTPREQCAANLTPAAFVNLLLGP